MKTCFYITTIFILFLTACQEEKVPTYDGDNYLQFSNPVSDSVTVSFQYYPGKEVIDWPVEIEMSGLAYDERAEYKISVVDTLSTAIANVHYKLPERFYVKAGVVADTCWVQLIKTDDMDEKEYRLVLRIDDNENFKFGPIDYTFQIIRISNKISKPDWWNSTIVNSYLGEYSDRKYIYFIQVTEISDMSEMSDSEKRVHCLRFKYWLEEQKNLGNTIFEDDLTEMYVPIIG